MYPSHRTYPIDGLANLAPDGILITFADGHVRNLPRLTSAPFHYRTPADVHLERAQPYTYLPLKQAVVSASGIEPARTGDQLKSTAFDSDRGWAHRFLIFDPTRGCGTICLIGIFFVTRSRSRAGLRRRSRALTQFSAVTPAIYFK